MRFTVAINSPEILSLLDGIAAAEDVKDPNYWKSLIPTSLSQSQITDATTYLKARKIRYESFGGNYRGRLNQLRREMQRNNLDGFIVPKNDEHQGEYIAKESERLHWLTGFTGSAGHALILKNKAGIFVDGRYTLQAQQEVNLTDYECLNLTSCLDAKWLAKNLSKKNKLAFDPWLHSEAQIIRLKKSCSTIGIELVATPHNLIDKIWKDQPSAPISLVKKHEIKFSGEKSKTKRLKIAQILKNNKCAFLILSLPDSIAWLLNIRGRDVPFTPFTLSFAIAYSDSTIDWFIDNRKLTPEILQQLGPDVTINQPTQLIPFLKNLALQDKVMHICNETAPKSLFEPYKHTNGAIFCKPDPCQALKACKNKIELIGARNAHLRDGVAISNFLSWLNTQMKSEKQTEISVATYLEKQRQKNDLYQGLSFPTISGYGPNGAIVHYRVTKETNKSLKLGSLLLIDSGAQYLDGTTDVTRTVAIGDPSSEMKNRFTQVLKGHIALASIKFPIGTTGSQLDILARQFLWRIGLDYNHGTGHGVGSYLSVHEGPQRITKAPNLVTLKPGMIISNEPGYYKTNAYGIRIENLVLVKKSIQVNKSERKFLEFETLTLAPIDRNLINVSIMTNDEISWVNSYHQRVKRKLSSLVDKKNQEWMQRATAPL